jgi:uncharacterized protein (TIGR03067 family)
MQRLTALALAVFSGLTVAAPALKTPLVKEAPSPLLGEWVMETREFGGRPANQTFNMEFKADGTLVVSMNGEVVDTCRYTADAKKEPAELDWHMSGDNEESVLCIYKVEKDLLTLCMDGPAKTRPTAFKSPAGSTTCLCTLRRVAEKD